VVLYHAAPYQQQQEEQRHHQAGEGRSRRSHRRSMLQRQLINLSEKTG